MSCETTRREVERFLEGEAGRDALAALEPHTAGCAGCKKEVEGALRLATAVEGALAPPVPVGAEDRVMAAIAAEVAKNGTGEAAQAPAAAKRPRSGLRVGLAIAATMVLAMGGFAMFAALNGPAATSGAATTGGSPLYTAASGPGRIDAEIRRTQTDAGALARKPTSLGDAAYKARKSKGLWDRLFGDDDEELVVVAKEKTDLNAKTFDDAERQRLEDEQLAAAAAAAFERKFAAAGKDREGREREQAAERARLLAEMQAQQAEAERRLAEREARNGEELAGLKAELEGKSESERRKMQSMLDGLSKRPDSEVSREIIQRTEGSVCYIYAESYIQLKGSTTRTPLAKAEGTGFAVSADRIVAAKHVIQPWKYDAKVLAYAKKTKEEMGLDIQDYVEVHFGTGRAFKKLADTASGTLRIARIMPDHLGSTQAVEIEWNEQRTAVAGIQPHVRNMGDLVVLRVPAGGLKPVRLADRGSVQKFDGVLLVGTVRETAAGRLISTSPAKAEVQATDPEKKIFSLNQTVAPTFAGAPVLKYDGSVWGVVAGTDGPNLICHPAELIRKLLEDDGSGGSGGSGENDDRRSEVPFQPPLDDLKGARLYAYDRDGNPTGAFPLEKTDVSAEVAGIVSSTLVEQRFSNPYSVKIEAAYCFPLPETAAVNEFTLQIGDRRIRGIVREKQEARRIYAAARARGQVASLLEQERPNVFLQQVANIEPGKSVDVKIRYFHALPCVDGALTYVFPMVVGHRYGSDARAAGHSAVTPPRVAPGMRPGNDISVTVDLGTGVPLEDVASPSHDVSVERGPDGRTTVRLARKDEIADRDFILRIQLGSRTRTTFGAVAHASERGRFFTLLLAPPVSIDSEDVIPREVFFILDSSGSMAGTPIEQCKRFMRHALAGLRAGDTFDVATFAGDARLLSEQFMAPTPGNTGYAMRWVEALHGEGGTEAEKGIRLALEHPRDPRRVRIVAFLTDGGVSFEGDIFARIRRSGSGSRVFALGVGSAPNRHLLEGMAEAGRGVAAYIAHDAAESTVARSVKDLYRRIDAPVLVDASIDWCGLPVVDVFPREVPDLFIGQTLAISGRFAHAASGTVTIRGLSGGKLVERAVQVTLPDHDERNVALASIWARTRIKDLEGRIAVERDPEARADLEKQVKNLAIEFELASTYTSFVAVDSESETAGGAPVRVDQPVAVPAGVDPRVFGR